MMVEGDSLGLYQELFPNGLVPQILELLVGTWRLIPPPTQDEDEPKITNRFVVAMQQEKRRRGMQFRIMAHAKDLAQLNPTTGRGFAEIDIYVPHGYEDQCYFGIEAKKLNTTSSNGHWKSNAGEYADRDGMGCFVAGRYSALQCEGAMVGYVMDGDCIQARASIATAINARASELHVAEPCSLEPARHLPNYEHAFVTNHDLDRGQFTIHHVLLAA